VTYLADETESAEFGVRDHRQCFWRVEYGYRPCGNTASYWYGPTLGFCHVHDKKFVGAILAEVRENPEFRDALIAHIADYDRDEARVWSEHRREVREWPHAYRRAHCVYFAEREGFVKIGRTANVKKRMHSIGKGSCMPQGMSVGPVRLLAVIYCDCTGKGCVRERHFHERFRDKHLEGEWFLFDREINAFVGGLEECLDDRLREVSSPRPAA
jgi:hypothetical protein